MKIHENLHARLRGKILQDSSQRAARMDIHSFEQAFDCITK
jgi:hypothetical protein